MTAPIRSRNEHDDYTAFDPDHDLACAGDQPGTVHSAPRIGYDDTLGLPNRVGLCDRDTHSFGADRLDLQHDWLDPSCHEPDVDPCALALPSVAADGSAPPPAAKPIPAAGEAKAETKLVWGGKVSLAFKEKVIAISQRLGCDPNDLMACMAFETGGSFQADQPNKAGSKAVGLIQFMPFTAARLHTTVAQLEAMHPEDQLDYVEQYLLKVQHDMKQPLHTLEDLYMAILWPEACGKDMDYALFRENDAKHPKFYAQNAGLDRNHDGVVTKFEAAAAVRAQRAAGEKDAR